MKVERDGESWWRIMQRVRAFSAGLAVIACGVLAPLAIHWLAGRTLVWFDTARLYAPER